VICPRDSSVSQTTVAASLELAKEGLDISMQRASREEEEEEEEERGREDPSSLVISAPRLAEASRRGQ